jgi:alpha-ribazole phosphatase
MMNWNENLEALPAGVTQRIVLIRHGEPSEKIHGYCYGKLDVGLSEIGREQIKKAANFVKHLNLSAIYASPRVRATESASIIAKDCETFYSINEHFCEIDFGDFEGLAYTEIEQKFPAEFKIWMETPTEAKFPNGESFTEMQARVLQVISELKDKHRGEQIAIVSHGGVNRIILAHYLNVANKDIFRLEQTYANVNIIDFYDDFPVVRLMNRVDVR